MKQSGAVQPEKHHEITPLVARERLRPLFRAVVVRLLSGSCLEYGETLTKPRVATPSEPARDRCDLFPHSCIQNPELDLRPVAELTA